MSKWSAASNATFVRCAATPPGPIVKSMTPLRDRPLARLVIADDRPRARRALRALLATCTEFEVVGEAEDGQEAVASVERLRPNLILLDVRMPRLDGITATTRIKSRWPGVRIVAHSVAPDQREAALAAGADAFVVKGGPVEELLAALRAQPSAR